MKKFLVLVLTLVLALAACTTVLGEGYRIGFSDIYLTPSWMQQMKEMLDERTAYWQEKGVIEEVYLANANGDNSKQISDIQNMVAEGYDAIIVIAGSATALNNAIDEAMEKGVVVVNTNSLVTTDVTSVLATSDEEYGDTCARWLCEELGGKGKIIMFSGPAGVATSDLRQQGAEKVIAEYPDIEVVTVLNSEYNEAPALEMITPVLDAYEYDGILALGGSLACASLKALVESGKPMVPITGENYNGFVKLWYENIDAGFTSIAVGEPNWEGALALDLCIKILNGEEYSDYYQLTRPVITNDNIDQYVPNDIPDDYYLCDPLTDEEYVTMLEVK